jgi:hypothetical protein
MSEGAPSPKSQFGSELTFFAERVAAGGVLATLMDEKGAFPPRFNAPPGHLPRSRDLQTLDAVDRARSSGPPITVEDPLPLIGPQPTIEPSSESDEQRHHSQQRHEVRSAIEPSFTQLIHRASLASAHAGPMIPATGTSQVVEPNEWVCGTRMKPFPSP